MRKTLYTNSGDILQPLWDVEINNGVVLFIKNHFEGGAPGIGNRKTIFDINKSIRISERFYHDVNTVLVLQAKVKYLCHLSILEYSVILWSLKRHWLQNTRNILYLIGGIVAVISVIITLLKVL